MTETVYTLTVKHVTMVMITGAIVSKSLEIIGLGYGSLDYLALVPHVPSDDKVEIIQSLIQGGGPAATATVAAARLGAAAGFIGSVGDDESGQIILDAFLRDGVTTEGIVVRKDAESPVAYCWIDEHTGKRSIAWTRGSAQAITPEEININSIKNAKALHLDGHQTEAAIFAAEVAREHGVIVSLDAGTVIPKIDRLVKLADIVIASELFLKKFTGESDNIIAIKKLFTYGQMKFAGVTMGDKGSLGFDGKNDYFQSAFPTEVVDTTGAGDVFHGAFVYRYVKGGNWTKCLQFASAAAAIKCMKLGGRSGIATLDQIENFLRNVENQ